MSRKSTASLRCFNDASGKILFLWRGPDEDPLAACNPRVVFRPIGWVLPMIQTTGIGASIRSMFRPTQGASSAHRLVGGGLYQSLVEQRCRFLVALVARGKMQRVPAVLDAELEMRKSLRRLRTEDYQRG